MQENDDLPVPDELTTLKARADKMGLSYHPSIGVDKLREKVTAALEGNRDDTSTDSTAGSAVIGLAEETPNQRKLRKKREAGELIRIRVTCMNPNKRDWDGEIFSASNSTVGTFKKYVPFNADEGWHVPNIIYQVLKDRECQVFSTVTGPRGNKFRKGKLIKEFAIEVLPPLTQKELDELARRQAMAKSAD